MDLQAKSYWLCLVPHNGDCGCSTCHIKSRSIKSGKGHAKGYLHEDYKTTPRTAESFVQDAELAHNSGQKVTTPTVLLKKILLTCVKVLLATTNGLVVY